MSRVDDLVDLIQIANDIYLINPHRNVRMAYVLIDDLCELTMKSWLQVHVSDWTPVSRQNGERKYYKSFKTIIDEVKGEHHGSQALHDILDRFDGRREKRNRFFHNQNLAGLTVTEDECKTAFCDLYDLMHVLFNPEFQSCLTKNPLVRAQIAVVKLKSQAAVARLISDCYQQILAGSDSIELRSYSVEFEYHQICRDPGAFLDRVLAHFSNEVFEREQSIAQVQKLRRPDRRHKDRLHRLQAERDTIQSVIDNCLAWSSG